MMSRGVEMLSDSERLYILIVQYGLARDAWAVFLFCFVRGFAVKARACALVGALG